MIHRLRHVLVAAIAIAAWHVAAPAHAADTVAETKKRCSTCHQGPRGFAGRPVAEVQAAIQKILDGKRPHPPLSLPDKSADAIAVLAERLTAE